MPLSWFIILLISVFVIAWFVLRRNNFKKKLLISLWLTVFSCLLVVTLEGPGEAIRIGIIDHPESEFTNPRFKLMFFVLLLLFAISLTIVVSAAGAIAGAMVMANPKFKPPLEPISMNRNSNGNSVVIDLVNRDDTYEQAPKNFYQRLKDYVQEHKRSLTIELIIAVAALFIVDGLKGGGRHCRRAVQNLRNRKRRGAL